MMWWPCATPAGDDGPWYFLLAVREQRGVQSFPGRPAQRTSRQFIALLENGRTLNAPPGSRVASRPCSTLFSIRARPVTSRSPRKKSELSRYLPAKCQPVSEETGEGGLLRLEYGGVTIATLSDCGAMASNRNPGTAPQPTCGTLHGVVFDILVGSVLTASSTAPGSPKPRVGGPAVGPPRPVSS